THQASDVAVAEKQEQSERQAALAGTELFGGLDPEERQLLALVLKTESFASGEQIIRQGENGTSLYLIRDGEVGVRLAVAGHEREVATLHRGEFFGEMPLMTGEPRRATCAAKGDTSCYVIEHEALRRVLTAKPEVAEIVSTALGRRQSALEGERENLSAEARALRAEENSSRFLARIRNFFNLG